MVEKTTLLDEKGVVPGGVLGDEGQLGSGVEDIWDDLVNINGEYRGAVFFIAIDSEWIRVSLIGVPW